VHNDAVIIVQARMESSRLPGKALMPLCGTPLIVHLLDRLETLPFRGPIAAVSAHTDSRPLIDYLEKHGTPVFAGDPENCYRRFLGALEKVSARALVRATADNPLIDTDAVRRGVDKLLAENLDYLWMENAPAGLGCDIFNVETFRSFARTSLTPKEAEHLVYIFRDRPRLRGGSVRCRFPEGAPRLRLTVDTEADYRRMSEIFERHRPGTSHRDLERLVREEMSRTP
jgi:spore coat polysaccharide biosynthesis protein SpsF